MALVKGPVSAFAVIQMTDDGSGPDGSPEHAILTRRKSERFDSQRRPAETVMLALTLTALAGFVDAVGYAQLGHLFLSFMSGNTTHLGMSLAASAFGEALSALLLIASFVAGVWFGTILFDRNSTSQLRVVLTAEMIIIVLAIGLGLLGVEQVPLMMVTSAMGMQNVLHQSFAAADMGKGFITGSLFSLGQSLARKGGAALAAHDSFSWLAFLIGVVLGGVSFSHIGLYPSLAVTALLIAGMIAATKGAEVAGFLEG